MNNTPEIWLNIEEVCELSNSKKETIRRKCKSGEYKARYKIDGRKKNYEILLSSLPIKYIQKYNSYLQPVAVEEKSLEDYSNAPKWMRAKAEKYLELFNLTKNMTYQEKIDFLADWSAKYPEKHTTYPSLSLALRKYNQGGITALLSNYGVHRRGISKLDESCFEYFKSIYLRETPLWCMVYDDLEYGHEADIFANQQKYVKPLTPYEIFIANIEAENEEQLTIKALVESYNLFLAPIKTPGGICAISTLEYIYRKFGYHILDATLRLCIATWEGDINSLTANILKGIAKLIVAYGDDLDEVLFKEKLGRCSIREITRNASERSNGSLGYAEAMLSIYNKRMRTPLQYSKLYSKRKIMTPDFIDNARDDYLNNNEYEDETSKN